MAQTFAQLNKQHSHLEKHLESDAYYRLRDELKNTISTYVDSADLTALKTKQLLKLTYWVYKYNVMSGHRWALQCEKALNKTP